MTADNLLAIEKKCGNCRGFFPEPLWDASLAENSQLQNEVWGTCLFQKIRPCVRVTSGAKCIDPENLFEHGLTRSESVIKI